MRRTSARARIASTGFTLVEVLVALTLLGLIVVMIGGTFRIGARAWDVSARSIDAAGQVEAVQNLLRRELAQADRLFFETPDGGMEPVFDGSGKRLRFAAPLSVGRTSAGLYALLFEASGEEGSADLALSWQAFRPDPADRAQVGRAGSALLDGIQDIRLVYFGRVTDDASPAWHGEWRGLDNLPDLIAIDVVFPEGDRRAWPSLVVALRAKGAERK
jgi:general secretion pathway protein J